MYEIQSGNEEEYSISPVYSSSVCRMSAMSSQPEVEATSKSLSEPLHAFHWEIMSAIVIGVPSSQTRPGCT